MSDTTSQGALHINREFQEKSALKQAHALGLPYIDLAHTPLNPDFLKVISLEECQKGRLVSFFRVGKSVRVAVEDPQRAETESVLSKLRGQGFEVSLSLASSAGMDEALSRYLHTQQYKKIRLIKKVDPEKFATFDKEIAGLKDLPAELEKVTAEEAVNALNIAAMKTAASDVHYEPEHEFVVVRFRIDGMLYRACTFPHELYEKILNQIKYQAKMTLNTPAEPQDGRYEFMFNEAEVAVRTASIPTPHGEALVCRYLQSGNAPLTFEELGFSRAALTKLQNATHISHGMILITGPTGSGKSTTLYSLITAMNTSHNKTITLEDPVEYHISGVTQSQINEKKGYTFSSGLRSILRHDPDIVMIGEIRDLATAETAMQASLTGHVLLSTLHTNSVLESITRLVNMGVPPFMVAPGLHTLIGQRLVRRACPKCATQEPLSASERAEFEEVFSHLKEVFPNESFEIPAQTVKIHGCEECSQTGYKGRMVIAEVLTVTEEMKRLILDEASMVDLIAAARKEGMITIREDGFLKVAQGVTTLEEVYRATNFER